MTLYRRQADIPAGSDIDLVSVTPTFDASSMAVAVGVTRVYAMEVADKHKIRLYMDAVQVAESGFVTYWVVYVVVGTRALSGAKVCKMSAHNYDSSARYLWFPCGDAVGNKIPAGIGVGSIKAT